MERDEGVSGAVLRALDQRFLDATREETERRGGM
jgi:hypothetical protein